MCKQLKVKWLLLAVCVSSLVACVAFGQSNGQEKNVSVQPGLAASSPTSSHGVYARRAMLSSSQGRRERRTLEALWGIDNINVKEASSGVLLRLSYRVLDANKAKALNDEKATPYLIDEKTGAALQVPSMPFIGPLRQITAPVNGIEYWMTFSNKGNFVKPGNRVDIVIGKLRINGIVVQN